MELKILTLEEWKNMAEYGYKSMFNHNRKGDVDRIDYAVLALEKDLPVGFTTVMELDKTSAYLQYGGIFKQYRGTGIASDLMKSVMKLFLEKYKRINIYVENDNIKMLKLAFNNGFKVIGIKYVDSNILCNLECKRGE